MKKLTLIILVFLVIAIFPVISLAGELEEAQEKVRQSPNDANVNAYLGDAYHKLGQYQDAVKSYKEAIRINLNFDYAHYSLGLSYSELGQHQDAINSCKEAIRINPNFIYAHLVLGFSYSELGQHQDTINSLKEAIRINPNFAFALFGLGIVYQGLGQYQDAIKSYKEAIRVAPDFAGKWFKLDDAVAHEYLGSAYEGMNRNYDAIVEYKEALRVNPDLARAQNKLKKLEQKLSSEMLAKEERKKQKSRQNIKEAERLAQERRLLEEERKRWEASRRIDEENKQQSKEQSLQSGTGSGFFVSRMGHVVTNAHVVKSCTKVMVGDNANKQVPAKVINTDSSNDLALLKLSSLDLASAESKSLIQKLSIVVVPLASKGLLRSEDVRLGEKVLVAGYPFGDIFSNTIKVTSGIVSATRGAGDDTGQFQLDAAVQPGNSGGPIYDSSGNIVGVVISQLDKLKVAKAIGSLPENVNFGIKASTVRQFLISSGLPSKKAEQTHEKSTEQLAEIAQNQALMVMCLNDEIIRPSDREQIASIPPALSTEPSLEQLQKRDAKKQNIKVDPIISIREMNALGRYQEAVDMAEKVAKEFPDHAKLHTWWGISLVKLKKKQEAIDHFVIAAKNDPADEKAHLYWGLTLAMDKNFEEAITHYRTVLEINSKHGNAYAYWGASLNALEKFGEALTKIDESLSLDPLNNTAHALRIDILYNLKRYKEAWQAVHKAQAAKIVVSKGSLDRLAKAFPDDFKGEGNLGVMFPLDPLIVNLAGSGGKRFLKVAISLELSTPDVHAEIKENIQKITDSILVLLSNKSFDDVYSVQGKFKLKDEITTRVNRLLMEENVKDTYFTEFIIQ